MLPERLQVSLPINISRDLQVRRMRLSVHFNDQFDFATNEVREIWPDWFLPDKLKSINLPISKPSR